jgi:hypothetical protein
MTRERDDPDGVFTLDTPDGADRILDALTASGQPVDAVRVAVWFDDAAASENGDDAADVPTLDTFDTTAPNPADPVDAPGDADGDREASDEFVRVDPDEWVTARESDRVERAAITVRPFTLKHKVLSAVNAAVGDTDVWGITPDGVAARTSGASASARLSEVFSAGYLKRAKNPNASALSYAYGMTGLGRAKLDDLGAFDDKDTGEGAGPTAGRYDYVVRPGTGRYEILSALADADDEWLNTADLSVICDTYASQASTAGGTTELFDAGYVERRGPIGAGGAYEYRLNDEGRELLNELDGSE